MKTKRFAKILTLALSFAMLIACIIGVSASASETDSSASAEIKLVTLNYGADVKIAYALNITGAEASDVALCLYKTSDLSDTPVVSNFSGGYYNTSYPVYYSMGIAAKDLADYIYAVPVLKASGEAIGEACRYSVAQYCYSVLQDPEASADLATLAEELLTYGASAQTRLINIGNIEDEALVTEYSYVYTTDANVYVEGNYKTTLVAPGETFVPVYTGIDTILGWELKSTAGTVKKTVEEAAQGISVNSATKVEPLYSDFVPTASDFEEGYINDDNIISYETNGTAVGDTASEYDGNIDYAVVDDPSGADNKVLKVVSMAPNTSKNAYSKINMETAAEGNCYIYESRLFVTSQESNANIAYIYFYDTAGTVAFYLNYTYDATEGEGVLRMCTKPSGKDVFTEIGRFAADKWVNMRLELYKSSVAEENCVKLYLGESAAVLRYVGGLETCPRTPESVNSDPLDYIKYEYSRKDNFTAYFDDVSFTRVDKEYIAED